MQATRSVAYTQIMDIGELRRRVGREIDAAKREAGERRVAVDAERAAYLTFIDQVATPLAKQLVTVLRADGHQFTSFTPPGSVRVVSDRAAGDFIEIDLDQTSHPPQVIGRTSLARGGKGVLVEERPICPGRPIGEITDDDVVTFLLPEIRRLILRG
jgi:hypothetical protein